MTNITQQTQQTPNLLKTKEIKIGTIQAWLEADNTIAQNIIEKYSEINVDYEWWDCILEDFCEDLEKSGFYVQVSDIEFSGFHSQGDGASFTGYINILEYLKSTKQLTKYSALVRAIRNDKIGDSINISRFNGYYSHENTCSVDEVEYYDYDSLSDKVLSQITEIESELEDTRCEFSQELYKKLDHSYEYLTSPESIIETLSANEYEFDEYLQFA